MNAAHNGSGYYGLGEEMNDAVTAEHFHASSSSDPSTTYARTGYLGFIKRSEKTNTDGCELNASCVSVCMYNGYFPQFVSQNPGLLFILAY